MVICVSYVVIILMHVDMVHILFTVILKFILKYHSGVVLPAGSVTKERLESSTTLD